MSEGHGQAVARPLIPEAHVFTTLLASNAPKVQARGSTAASVALHAALIGAAVWLTAQQVSAHDAPPNAAIVFVPAPAAPVQPTRAAEAPRTQAPAAAAPPSAPVISVPTVAPVGLPGIDASAIPSAEHLFSVGPARQGTPGSSATTSAGGGDAPFDGYTVDKPVEPFANQPVPRYPAMLRSAGVEGRVDVRFVVDTLGRVEPASIQIIDSTHQQFVDSVLSALLRQRFLPAEVAGRRVRQLVTQPFVFTITR